MDIDALSDLRSRLAAGSVIPAHPLALTPERKLDELHQRALTRYYLAAGAGGIAVGVHTTQFEIHHCGLYQPALELAVEEVARFKKLTGKAPITVAGIVGKTAQAVREAELASRLGCECGLLSLGAMKEASDDELLQHARAVAEAIPLFGFYLQAAVGGRILEFTFWRRFAEIENLVAIKIAPFNRYQTVDVVRGVAEAGRVGKVALYTGNDDSIVADLLTEFRFKVSGRTQSTRIVGGLLGHWAVWTRRAVGLHCEIQQLIRNGSAIPSELLTRGVEITDANAALFDPQHQFAGCIAGIHEVLRRQGLMKGRWCLNPQEDLSAGQMEEIDRVYQAYPHLNDDEFVREHLEEWLS